MIHLKRRKPKRFGTDRGGPIRCPSHLAWVRGHECIIDGRRGEILTALGIQTRYHRCSGRIVAAHVRTGTDGGTSVKPSDSWTVALCDHAHEEQHQIGEAAFEKRYAIDMKALASQLWQSSPHGRAYRLKRERES